MKAQAAKPAQKSARKEAPSAWMLPSISPLPSWAPALQRRGCACGGSCPSCREQPLLQTKLEVSEPGDFFEREADRVADAVMRMNARGGGREHGAWRVPAATPARALPPGVGEVLRSPGRPLDAAARAFMEPRFGRDFDGVRIHTDADATRSARDLGALAYTAGDHIVFRSGHYDPLSHRGRRLLAHELAHVVQQRGGAAQPADVAHASGSATRVARGVIQRQPASDKDTCSKRDKLSGYENIRNVSRERLRARGFVFCGPDYDMDPELWERWVHPSDGVLHFQVKWKDTPDPSPPPDKPDDRQKRCADPCTEKFDNQAECKKCCEDTIPASDTKCRSTCNVACSLLLDEGPSDKSDDDEDEDQDQ